MVRITGALTLMLTSLRFATLPSPLQVNQPAIASQRQSSICSPKPQSSEELTSPEVQRLIEDDLASEPTLADARARVETDDCTVQVMGTVKNERQRYLVLQIAQSFAKERQIIDNLTIEPGNNT